MINKFQCNQDILGRANNYIGLVLKLNTTLWMSIKSLSAEQGFYNSFIIVLTPKGRMWKSVYYFFTLKPIVTNSKNMKKRLSLKVISNFIGIISETALVQRSSMQIDSILERIKSVPPKRYGDQPSSFPSSLISGFKEIKGNV